MFCRVLFFVLVICSALQAEESGLEKAFCFMGGELCRINRERLALNDKLLSLPQVPPFHLTERIGFHAGYSPTLDSVEWIEMHFDEPEVVDAIVLIAASSSSPHGIQAGYGFPVRFRVEIRGEGLDEDRLLIADMTQRDFPNPGGLPVFIPVNHVRAQSIRITATRLFRDGERYVFSLGEMMVLQGKRNITAGHIRQDFSESRTTGAVPMWGVLNLIDGHTVLGPPVGSQPSPTLGYQSILLPGPPTPQPQQARLTPPGTPPEASPSQPRWVEVDLGTSMPLEEVRLFPANPPTFAHRLGYGFPPKWVLQISDDPQFKTATVLSGLHDSEPLSNITSPGNNVLTFVGEGKSARYVRFTALELHNANGAYNLALAEMEVWSGGRNVALGKPVHAFDSMEQEGWSAAALVDGFNSKANIVDWPGWLRDLSTRRETEQALSELDQRRTHEIERLRNNAMIALGIVIMLSILLPLLALLRQRRIRRLELENLRQRISQDLHDEIGSSLGSIALVTQDVLATAHDPSLRRDLVEISDIAGQTLDSMRDIVRLVQTGVYGQGDLIEHLREIADRMLRGIPHTLQIDADSIVTHLPMHMRRDLVLMFKECLHNLVRHAKATKAIITLTEENNKFTLKIWDNGRGFDPETPRGDGMGLTNLQRRAVKHGGSVQIRSAPAKGTTLSIFLPTNA